MISTERHSQHQAMEELQDFKLADLFAKLRLDDDEFHEWPILDYYMDQERVLAGI